MIIQHRAFVISFCCLLTYLSNNTYAESLTTIIRSSTTNDPAVLEADANEHAAAVDIDIARAGHYPTLHITGDQPLTQHHRYHDNNHFNLSAQASLNLYAWGGIEARVQQNQHRHAYYHYKTDETRENISHNIGKLYLTALRAKELILGARNNLQRHDHIIHDLKIITHFDKGRMSELDQALARQLKVQSYIAEQTRILELNLSRLGKYTQKRLNPAALTDPFQTDDPNSLIQRFGHRDLSVLPAYQAQNAERNSVLAEHDVRKAARYPSINLLAKADRHNHEAYINLSWDAFNPTNHYEIEKNAHSLIAAEAKMDQILRDSAEHIRSAETDMRQSLNRANIAAQQIAAQKKVIKAYELQFKIARRTLIDVLNAYTDLADIELQNINAQNDYRDAALEYLFAQAAITKWANSAPSTIIPENHFDKNNILATPTTTPNITINPIHHNRHKKYIHPKPKKHYKNIFNVA